MVAMSEKVGDLGIKKTLIKEGNGKRPTFGLGSKATFHFKSILSPKAGEEVETVIDDSKKHLKPFELLIGKKFKLQCWEECVKTMLHGEISRFHCPVEQVLDYPTISRSLRDLYHGKDHTSHTCGLHAIEDGLGYDDLNKLQKHLKPITFELELLKVEEPDMYEKELWQMDAPEMLANVPRYHEEGNRLFKDGKIAEAEKKYANAIGCLKHLQIKERPGTDSWVDLDKKQIPLLLNYAQCKLNQNEFSVCITNCTEVLEKIDGTDNVKALFKRGKAHAMILNEKECKSDFQRAIKLDPTVQGAVNRELTAMGEREKQRDSALSKHLKGMFN
uniref:AIP/AIPL N-terminal FKBP-type PPIase domain-containing protein n=1 Tax=Ciona savignyi TaxID=51511 RepID=H2YH26_CIOSA